MGPEALAQVLRPLSVLVPTALQPNLLVGLAEGDDAAVYKLNDAQALIFTVDFFTPVVDDPLGFGSIAAANALSDIYATGGEPLLALNISAFPASLDPEILAAIVRGGAEKAAEAGCAVAGGHTITDKEPKFGMAVIGLGHPDRLFLKSQAREGDVLLLTKALGTGVITTAAKGGYAPLAALDAAVDSMKRLNRDAARVFMSQGLRCATDITGFSLIGHALEIAEKSGLSLEIDPRAPLLLPEAENLAAAGRLPGGTTRNRQYYAGRVEEARNLSEPLRALLYSPETSGGLLAALPADKIDSCLAALRAAGLPAVRIGTCFRDASPPRIRLV